MTDTPRDGLTDADLLALAGECGARLVRSLPASLSEPQKVVDIQFLPAQFFAFARAIEAKIRAADREARPAPASVEVVAWQVRTPGGEWRTVRGKLSDEYVANIGYEVRELGVIDRLAAASTPPAEAQPTPLPDMVGMVPQHIFDAADKVGSWFAERNIKGWQLLGLRDRWAGATPPAEAGTVPWPVIESYAGGADLTGGFVNVRFGDGPETVRYVPAASEARATGDAAAPKALDDPRLQALFSDAIEGALAFGYQQNNHPPEGHWLTRFWNIGNAEAEKAHAALSDRSTGAVPAGWKLLKDTTHDERSWPEDKAGENGWYACTCCQCLRDFNGYKRRVVCKVCASAPAAPPVAPADAWTVIAPDGTRFDGPTPYQAARLANAHGRKTDPVLAAQFDAMQEEFQRSNEAENARLIALHGSLDCPTCGGSGHVGDTQRAATGAAGEPQPREGWKWVPVEPTDDMLRKAMDDCGAIGAGSCGEHWGVDWDDMRAVWEAMLAAVPQADSGAAGGQGDSNGD